MSTAPSADRRNVALAEGDVNWLFPTLTESTEHRQVSRTLHAADAAHQRLALQLASGTNTDTDALSLLGLTYQRLGPSPAFPCTVLMAERGTRWLSTFLICTPAGHGPFTHPGPPWQVTSTVTVKCDSDPRGCAGHEVDVRIGEPILTPLAAGTEIRAAVEWLRVRLAGQDEKSIRAQDPQRGLL